jgi:hypothetical protein
MSERCGASLVIEWDDSRGEDTPKEAIQSRIDWHTKELGEIPEGAKGGDPAIPLEQDPIRLAALIRGLTAALEEVDNAVATAEPGSNSVVVTGKFEGVPISEVTIVSPAEGGYRVGEYSAIGLTIDDPICAKP